MNSKIKFFQMLIFFIFLSTVSMGRIVEDYEGELQKLKWMSEKMKDKDHSTRGMIIAEERRYEGLDKLLNRYYKDLMETLDPEQKIALRDSQREWIKFRDKEIKLAEEIYYKKQGTVWALYPGMIAVELMENRTKEIVYF
ncbi:MAG: lysozyme inhibitor LprI family protein, partial [Fusobacteriaceae bacterium]